MIQRFKILRKEYRFRFEISLVSSLLLCILLFLFFPKISPPLMHPPVYQTIIFTINDGALNTVQADLSNPKPSEPKIVIDNVVDDPEILPDVKILSLQSDKSSGNGKSSGNSLNSSGINAPLLPFIPRQILEVLPSNIDGDFTGYIDLRLKIGTDGKVIEHKVIANTTGSNKYLQNVITAAYKSRWEPIKINNSKIDYWVEKTYTFK